MNLSTLLFYVNNPNYTIADFFIKKFLKNYLSRLPKEITSFDEVLTV